MPTIIKPIICYDCARLNMGPRETPNIACEAFKEGIPDEIIYGEVVHTSPYPGDHGLQFVPKAKGDKDAEDD